MRTLMETETFMGLIAHSVLDGRIARSPAMMKPMFTLEICMLGRAGVYVTVNAPECKERYKAVGIRS